MRRTMTRMGLGLALVVGAAGAAAAQSTRPDSRPDTNQSGERGMRRGGRGGPERALLKDIKLTNAQKDRLKAIRKEQEPEMKKTREQFGAVMKEARDARQRGDTVAARTKMDQVRTQMNAQRERQVASLRTILTTDQQKQLDANVAEWKERAAKGGRGDRDGHPRKSGNGR